MSYNALNADQRAGATLNGKPSLTIEEAADRIAGRGWNDRDGQPLTITYAYRASAPESIPGDAGGFTQFNGQQIDATERALKAWADVANITFVRAGGGYSDNATILFGNYTTGEQDAAAFSVLPGNRASTSANGDVWVNATLNYMQYPSFGASSGFMTLVHEIGHSLGLLHPSDYDVGGSTDPTYAHDASYAEDSNEYTIMSYFDPDETGGSIQEQSPLGPLLDDVAAIQQLYGANRTTRTGNDTYGDGVRWGTIWDAGGVDTINLHGIFRPQMIDLRPGHFSNVNGNVGNVSIAVGTIIENAIGGELDDVIIGNAADNVLNGESGNDVLQGGLGSDTYIGGFGTDRAILNGNVGDYGLLATKNGLQLRARNGSGHQWIDQSTEIVQFRNGQYLSYKDVAAYVGSALPAGYTGLSSYAVDYSGGYDASPRTFDGTSGKDWLTIRGNVGDYALSRVQSADLNNPSGRQGDFLLTSLNGGQTLSVGQTVDVVQFDNGQYLSLKDLPAYMAGNAAFSLGTSQDDVLVQGGRGAHVFMGRGGQDVLLLSGNSWDYQVASFSGYHYTNYDSPNSYDGLFKPAGYTISTPVYSGAALVARNGTGVILVEGSTETVQFRNGDRMDTATLGARLDHFDETVLAFPDGPTRGGVLMEGTAGQDRLFLNRNAADYTLHRDQDGTFVMITGQNDAVDIAQNIETVQFLDGQYLSLKDFGAYIRGSAVFTAGGAADDLLFVARSGDQYVTGGGGVDHLYLTANVADYTITRATLAGGDGHAAIDGYELIAAGGSGNLYIDQSTDVIHFQSGQYLSFVDLTAYIHGAV